ncbi:MAG: PAS domain-containing protein [Campylobacterales bacterium]|nr:PAS domain-containing protein [Campylobacterales bacterium]
MFLKNKKKYSLLDLEKLFSKIPIFFIMLLAGILLIITFFILNSKEKSEIDLLKQKYYLNYKFDKKEELNKFILTINEDINNSFFSVESKLKKLTYKSIGFVKSNSLNDINLIKKYFKSLENENNVEFVIFKKDNLDILYGKDSLVYINNLIFSIKNKYKFLNITIKYIYSQGKDNLQYWKDDLKNTIRLSFFDSLIINNSEYYIGAFSTINSIKKISKNSIIKHINEKKNKFWFYNTILEDTYNFEKNKKYNSAYELLKKNKRNVESNILKNYISFYNYNESSKEMSYLYSKFGFLITVFYENFIVDPIQKDLIINIKEYYKNLYLQICIYIFLFTIVLLLFTFIFTNFIKKNFKEYNVEFLDKSKSLEHWKKRFELAIIASNDGLWDINFKSGKIYFSDAWLNMFFYEKDEIKDFDTWFSLIHKDDKIKVKILFDKVFSKENDSILCEYRLKTKHNTYKWVLARGKTFLDENGDIERMLMMSMDIDKNKIMKKELSDVNLLVEDGKIVIFKVLNNKNLSFSYISNSIKNYDYKKSDFENNKLSLLDLIFEEDVNEIKNSIKEALASDLNDFTFVCRMKTPKNEIKWISCRSILLKDHSGKVSHFYGYINDITKIKVSQEELKIKVKIELEKNRKKDAILIQQSKLAAMGEMLGSIAHQWRQPLNNVSLILQFLQDNYKSSDSKTIDKFMSRANKHIEYMSVTIDDFRDFYKPSKEKNDFYLNDCISSLLFIIQSEFEYQNINIITDIKKLHLNTYENELKQVILNILNNAKDAILLKKEKLSFEAYIKIESRITDSEIIIKISNNGGEIEDDIMQRIFEPYFTTKFESAGTGIGLYMSKTIIEINMKALIKVNNIKDGVEFSIIFKKEKNDN